MLPRVGASCWCPVLVPRVGASGWCLGLVYALGMNIGLTATTWLRLHRASSGRGNLRPRQTGHAAKRCDSQVGAAAARHAGRRTVAHVDGAASQRQNGRGHRTRLAASDLRPKARLTTTSGAAAAVAVGWAWVVVACPKWSKSTRRSGSSNHVSQPARRRQGLGGVPPASEISPTARRGTNTQAWLSCLPTLAPSCPQTGGFSRSRNRLEKGSSARQAPQRRVRSRPPSRQRHGSPVTDEFYSSCTAGAVSRVLAGQGPRVKDQGKRPR